MENSTIIEEFLNYLKFEKLTKLLQVNGITLGRML